MKDEPVQPVVSDVIGEGEEAHRNVSIGRWTLTAWHVAGADEPRIRDIDLAQRLGYQRPAKIRDLISAMIATGKLNGSEVFTEQGKTSARGGRPGTVYWLNEAQALKAASKSETDAADKLLDEMIAVYMHARRGLLPDAVRGLVGRVAAIEETVTSVLAKVRVSGAETPFIGKAAAAIHIHAPLSLALTSKFKALNILPADGDDADGAKAKDTARKRLWKSYEDMLRSMIDFPREKGRTWGHLPSVRLPDVTLAVNLVAHQIRTELKIQHDTKVRQLRLKDIPDETPPKIH